MRHKNVILCTGVTGFFIFVAGVALGWFGFPVIIFRLVRNELVLVNESEAFERWRKIPVTIQFKIYIFNVTNPDDVMQGANPIVQEVGPYCYDEYREKYDIGFDANDTLSYHENSTFYFNQKASGNLTEDDEITVLNAALVGSALKVVREYGRQTLGMIASIVDEIFVGSESIFMNASVKSLLWEGVTVINCSTHDSACDMLREQLPETIKETSPGIYDFSFFGHKNNSNNGKFRINRGIMDIEKLGTIEEWNDEASVNNWLGETCNMINGSDSTIFPPFRKSSGKLYIFITDVCRSFYAEYEGNVKVQGVPALRFVAGKHLLTDPWEYAPNLCFCDGEEDAPPEKLACLKSGALDLYRCLKVPLIMTFPHLYDAAAEYLGYVDGLHPQKEKHETFSDIEPNTGVPLQGAKRMQMNIFLPRTEELKVLSNVSEGLFPIIWAEEGVQLGEEHLSKFRTFAFVLCLMDVLKWLIPASGLLLLCFTCYKYVTTRTEQQINKVIGVILSGKYMAIMQMIHAAICCVAILKWLLPAIGILLMGIAMFICARSSTSKVMKTQDKNGIKICYGNKVFLPQPEIQNKTEVVNTLTISDLTNLIKNEKQIPRKRIIEKFPAKYYTRNSRRRNRPNSVGLNVTNDFNQTVSLSNVFM